MIPASNKEILLEKLSQGATIPEACIASQISKATLYRHLKDPEFKKQFDQAIFKAKDKVKEIDKIVEQRNMDRLKGLITGRKL